MESVNDLKDLLSIKRSSICQRGGGKLLSSKWEKVGVMIVVKPAAYGGGLYLRVPKRIAEAYELYTAEVVEFEVKRVRRRSRNSQAKYMAREEG